MAVSGINNYNNALYQWQGQKLSSSGNSSSSSSSAASSLFNGTSMVNQVSSMVELTKYAMNAMGACHGISCQRYRLYRHHRTQLLG